MQTISYRIWKNIASKEDTKKRIEICEKCEFFFRPTYSCKKCKCFLKLKTKVAKSKCPIDKWKRVDATNNIYKEKID